MNLIKSETVTMSSLEIAELTGKRHDHVMRDIRKMLDELDEAHPKFGGSYEDSTGRTLPCFNLDRDMTDCLLTGYSAKARMMVIKRWRELEEQQKPSIPQTYAAALLEAGRLAQLAEDQAEKLALAAPKVQFVDQLVDRGTLMTATQVGQKHKISAVKLNKILDEVGGIYSRGVKRSRVFTQQWIDNGYGEMKQTERGHSQALFTLAGEYRISEILTSEGLI